MRRILASAAVLAVLLVAGAAATPRPLAVFSPSGRLLLSSDGRSWRDATPPTVVAVDDVTFADRRHGWLVGADCGAGTGELLRTSDGGRTWSRRPFESHSCAAGAGFSLDFLDPSAGWVVHDEPTAPFARLYRTVDGGVTWRLLVDRLPTLGAVAFRTRTDGWLAGDALCRSLDGGRTWHCRDPVPPRGLGGKWPQFARPVFFGARGVVAAAYRLGSRLVAVVYRTSDGGAHWRASFVASTRAGVRLFGTVWLSAPAAGVAWLTVGGATPHLYVTVDGGRRWSSRSLRFPAARNLTSLAAFDGRTAVASTYRGSRPLAFVTHDGARTWRLWRR